MKKRITSLLLLIAVVIGALASCAGGMTDSEILAAADAELKSKAYYAVATTNLTTTSPLLAERIEGISNAGITYFVDGDDFTARMSTSVDGAEVERTYTVKDGVLYNESIAYIGGKHTVIRKKAELDSEKLSAAINELGAGAELNYLDFNSITRDGSDTECTITCTDVKSESLDGAEEILGSVMLDGGYELTLISCKLVMEIKDGKYNSVSLTYNYSIEGDGDVYTVSATLKTVYNYSVAVSVPTPDNASDFTTVSYENALK